MEKEPVLVVPPKLTKSAYAILRRVGGVAERWHLQGQHGSRTHRIPGNDKIGFPVLPGVAQQIISFQEEGNQSSELNWNQELVDLLQTDGVEIVYKVVPTPKSIPRDESVDATVHPERARHGIQTSIFVNGGLELHTNMEKCQVHASDFTFAELFSGIGGFGVALEALGGQCIFASEINKSCQRVFASNVRVPSDGIHGDIYAVSDKSLPKEGVLDLLVAGFPCQPFSTLGSQPGFLDGSRGLLYTQIVRVLSVCKPKAFLLENVPGLLSIDSALSTIVSSLENVGYKVAVEVCSSRGLTAQSRKRLYFVGLRQPDKITRSDNAGDPVFEFPFIPDIGIRCADILDYQLDPHCEDDPFAGLYHLSNDQMQQLLLCRYEKRRWKPAKLAWPDKVCDTIDGHYGVCVGNGNSQLVPCQAPLHPRRFTLRECARIMGFGETYKISSCPRNGQGERSFLKEHFQMFGNAVCPPVIAVIAGAILEHCPSISGYNNHEDWVEWGLQIALKLSLNSVLPHRKERVKANIVSAMNKSKD